MRRVTIFPALAWKCPCGQQNVHHGSTKIDEETKREAAETWREQGLAVEPDDMRCVPEHVWCVVCGEQFAVDVPFEEIEDEDQFRPY